MAAFDLSSGINYTPLLSTQEIRLIVLEHGSDDDYIICRLLNVELGFQAYEALSYEWGDPSQSDPKVSVNGKEVQVRQNLHHALQYL